MHRKLISAREALSLLPQEGAVHTVVSGLGIMGADLPVSAIIEHIQTHEVWLDLESAPLADHFLVIRRQGHDTYIEVEQEQALSIWYGQVASDHLCRLRSNAEGLMSYQQLYELIDRMPLEHRADAVTVFDREAGECKPIQGFGPIERQDASGAMLSVLDSGHPVITI